MAALTFADSHNMVAYLEKSEGNADFVEIVDFLNASSIRYALIVSPTIYVSYIEQFWSTAKTKIVNNETQIHAKVDGKTIVIIESFVRRDLHFNDEDGTVTPLFATMLIQPQADVGEGSGQPTEPQHTPTPASPSNIKLSCGKGRVVFVVVVVTVVIAVAGSGRCSLGESGLEMRSITGDVIGGIVDVS
ncbi:hypothetical protein Tco_1461000 [Tanacetum coccineum]